MKYWLGLNEYCPAPTTLAQHLTDIGSVMVCNLYGYDAGGETSSVFCLQEILTLLVKKGVLAGDRLLPTVCAHSKHALLD